MRRRFALAAVRAERRVAPATRQQPFAGELPERLGVRLEQQRAQTDAAFGMQYALTGIGVEHLLDLFAHVLRAGAGLRSVASHAERELEVARIGEIGHGTPTRSRSCRR